LQRARDREDTESLNVLQDLREELDQLAENKNRDLQEYMSGGPEYDDDMDMEAEGVELEGSGAAYTEMEAEGVDKDGEKKDDGKSKMFWEFAVASNKSVPSLHSHVTTFKNVPLLDVIHSCNVTAGSSARQP
jgi:hypothetical protein